MKNIAPFSWDAPDESLLEDRRGVLPQFPNDVFPSGLSDWLARASRGAGTLHDHVAVPMLGATSSLIGKARCIQASSSWIEPLTLWTAVVAQSGDRKTPGLRVITRALDQIEAENAPIQAAASVKHRARVEAAKVELKAWKKKCAEMVKKGAEPPPMPISAVDPGDFIHPALHVADSTIPRLARLCEVRPRGMLQVRDEISGLFSSMTAPGARQFYLEAWNGGRYVVERVADDRCIVVEDLLVGLTGGLQPDKLSSTFAGDQDGMYARLLYGWPSSPPYAALTDDVAEVDPRFQGLLTKLIRLPSEDEHGKFVPRIVPLSRGARGEFEVYRRFVDHTKRGIEGRESQWLAKSETHLLRLAGTLSFLGWADAAPGAGLEAIAAALEPSEIEQRFMIAAIELIQGYFWPHARAALRQIGLTDRHRLIRRVLRWLRANVHNTVSVKDIRREAVGGSVDEQETRELIDRLIEAGWLRAQAPIKTGGKAGGRPLERWSVNPRLFASAETAGTAGSEVSAVSAVPATSKTGKGG